MISFYEDTNCQKYFLISQDPINRKINHIELIFWKDFLEKLWTDEIII